MTIPIYQDFMLPLLQMLGDGHVHTLKEVRSFVAGYFQLKEDEKNRVLPSGKQTYFNNRIGWAGTYLKKALLIESPEREKFRITSRGQEVLMQNPERIDKEYLMRFAGFAEWIANSRNFSRESIEAADEEKTPREMLDESYRKVRQELQQELLDEVRRCSPSLLKKLVADLMVKMGYGGSSNDVREALTRRKSDEIRGVIKEDKLGLDMIYIQVNRKKEAVGLFTVQTFVGSLEELRTRKGVLITTSTFTEEAKDYASRIEKKIVMVDGERLTDLLIEHDIGTAQVVTLIISRKISNKDSLCIGEIGPGEFMGLFLNKGFTFN